MNKERLPITIGIVVMVVLVILFDTLLANHLPAIIGLVAEPERVTPSGSCQIVCNATDSDGDQLNYNWLASGGDINGEGATVTWTAPRSVGCYNVTVTVTDGRGGEVMDYVIIEVRANKPPTITSLVADADWTTPLGSLQVTCTASDPDGDELNYEWSTEGGDISGAGAVVNWTAPAEIGICYVTVVVRDGHGMEGTWSSLSLSVTTGTPPAIEKLCITPEGHKYLRDSSESGCDYDVWRDRDYNIECIASGTGELIYEWSYDDGVISGEGSTVTWTAPSNTSVKVTVTVIVSDAAANSVGKNIVLHVPSCNCGSWGLEAGCK